MISFSFFLSQQFETAIKDYKANKPVDFNELPCPPGFGPIPGETQAEPADPQEMAQMVKMCSIYFPP